MGGQGVLYIMAWVVCLLMGMGGLVEWEGCGAVCLFMGTEMKTIYRL
jgi:uncharacterized membrane protein